MLQTLIKKITYWPLTVALTVLLSLSTLSGPIALAEDAPTVQNTTTGTAVTGDANVNTTPVVTPPAETAQPPATPAITPTTDITTTPPADNTATTAPVNPVVLPDTPAPTCSTPQVGTDQSAAIKPSTPTVTTQASTTATIDNSHCATANTGDATVTDNKKAGSATTGDALTAATILNLLQASGNIGTTLQSLPTLNIDGNQKGDVTLNLDSLKNTPCDLVCSGLQVNKYSDGTINNTIVMDANSGDATVTFNKKAGDATSGDATVNLNLVNIINSLIASSKAFVGTININGSLDGDILLQGANLNNLNEVSKDEFGGAGSIGSSNTTINNNLDLSALTGNADVSNNKKAGSATSGDAKTGVNASNLIGTQVDGKNALLVFVNVMGKWQGMIVNNPDSINALLGDANQCACGAAHAGGDTNSTINNNIKLTSSTGNATVANNGKAGSATTGNAITNLSMLNIADSSFNLSDWFGILFINVYGSWDGSFGLDTAAGGTAATPGDSSNTKVVVSGIINKKTPKAKKTASSTVSVETASTGSGSTLVLPKVQGATKNAATISSVKKPSKYNIKLGLFGGLASFMMLGAVERRKKKSPKSFVAQTA